MVLWVYSIPRCKSFGKWQIRGAKKRRNLGEINKKYKNKIRCPVPMQQIQSSSQLENPRPLFFFYWRGSRCGLLAVLQASAGRKMAQFLPLHSLLSSVHHNLLLVLHTPRLHAGLLPRIPPVGYTDRSNPFSPNAPCSPDPLTISLYNKPIIHKSIRGLGSIPSKVLPLTQQVCFLVGFLSPLVDNNIEVCGRFAAVS